VALLQVIGARLRPTFGSVRIGGRSITGLSARALERLCFDFFGFVFQSYNLIATLNGWESVAVTFDLKGIHGSAAERRSRALVGELGMSSRADALAAADKRRKSSVSLLH
jgi:ABC-type lipoprotein export system ATPase subunit